jgi:predicted MPP superfamily phosphohydrolase
MLLLFSGCFFALPFIPLLLGAYFGPYGEQRHPWLLRDLLNASSIWWVGSLGCAIVIFAYNFFPRLIIALRPKPAVVDPERRRFLRKGVGVAATAPFVLSGYGVLLERRRFELEHFAIGVSGLSSDLSQFTIAQLTDIHLGPFMPPEELARYVEAVNRLKPDLIALTGDFITSSRSEVVPCVETLAGLKARHGIFACLGNHDTFSGAASKLTELLVEKGIHMLRNDSATIDVGNSKIAILGIDDLVVGRPDLQRAKAVAQPAEVNILLSHRPEIFPTAAKQGMDLVLSGHYHGGQIKLLPEPDSLSIARFLTPYAEGLFQLQRSAENAAERKVASLFVGRGVGITAVPIRINCPPQIAHLTLKNS